MVKHVAQKQRKGRLLFFINLNIFIRHGSLQYIYIPNRRTTFIGWCEGEERSIPLEVERKQSKDMRQRSVVATLSFTPVGDLQATDRSNLF